MIIGTLQVCNCKVTSMYLNKPCHLNNNNVIFSNIQNCIPTQKVKNPLKISSKTGEKSTNLSINYHYAKIKIAPRVLYILLRFVISPYSSRFFSK